MEQHNLCSNGDYLLQKQIIKASRKGLMSVSLLRRMLLERSEATLVHFRVLLKKKHLEFILSAVFCNPNFFFQIETSEIFFVHFEVT